MLTIYSSPLQGYTDHVWRRLHHNLVGGVAAYITPFLRLEGGQIRPRDIRDVAPENNQGVPVIPQVIVANREEFCRITDHLLRCGYDRADINLGCSFPMQTKLFRGAGMLPYPTRVEELMNEVAARSAELKCSVKLRLGMDRPDECLTLLPIINDAPLVHVAVHARTGRMLFRGLPDKENFARFAEGCRHPLFYNGDMNCPEDIRQLEVEYPQLKGVLVGRGLLARPTLGVEYTEGKEFSEYDRLKLTLKIHDEVYTYAKAHLQGGAQMLTRMQSYWEYLLPVLPRKTYKKIMKSASLITYDEALNDVIRYVESVR